MNIPAQGPARLDDWHRTLGNFLLNFGTLEYTVAVFLKDHLEPSEYAGLMKKPFQDRVARISKYLEDNDNAEEDRKEFAALAT